MTEDNKTETNMDLGSVRQGLIELVAQLPAAPSVVRVTAGEVSIEVEWPGRSAPTDANSIQSAAPPAEPVGTEIEPHYIRAKTVGAFYQAPAPDQPPFVSVGDLISAGQQVGILEAMKIMIPVEADCDGRVVEVLADDADPVEFGEPLLAVEPIAA
jgi:acetyl-CoA carboxylase biotin carboxyl carrier protein